MRTGMMAAVVGLAAGIGFGGVGASDSNAALSYYRAWATMNPDLAEMLDTRGETMTLEAGAAEQLLGAQEVIDDLIEASEIAGVDWEVKYADGFAALMPHLGKMRTGAKLVGADALRCAEAGDGAGAAERLGSLYRMAGHVSGDPLLISSMVGMAIGNLANDLTGQLIDDDALDADDAKVVLHAIGDADRVNRFGEREAIIGEWRIMCEYILRNARGDRAGAEMLAAIGMDADSEPTRAISRMNAQELLAEIGGLSVYHGDVLAAWDAGDRDELIAIETRIEQNQAYGAVARVLGVAVVRIYDSYMKQNSDTKALVERLQEVAD
jgi:hypothetical protein